MDTVISLLVLSTLLQLVAAEVASVTSLRAVVEITSGDSRIFSGESVRLKCSVPDVHRSDWKYLWFRGSDRLPQIEEHLVIWKSKVKHSGKYHCQGVRNTVVRNIHTLKSLPLEINVDGGWVILQVPPHPGLVGETLEVTCRLRVKAKLPEVILYKDGVEVMRQIGINPQIYLTNVTLEDQGMYSCRASWDADGRTHSAISVEASVQVAEVLSQPLLEIVADNNLFPVNFMKLICHLQYNARAPAPPIHFYFYKNKKQVATASSEKSVTVNRTPGQYSCKARVPELGISRESELRSFGQVTDLRPAAETTATRPSSHQSAATPTVSHPTGVSIQSSYQPQQSATSNFLSTVPSPNQTAAAMESDDTSGESGNTSGGSGDTSGGSGDTSGESGDMSGGSGDTSGE
uniref:Ig-like domain-containing protein n=1 Tax=Gasterosteus aculeatus aculeatus TaxID=481459 RepID=A0AAQ4NPW8_GASAC